VSVPVSFLQEDSSGECAIVVNFGVLSGREATMAEVDRLARRLLRAVERVTVTACRRHELAGGRESVVHQVIVERLEPATAAGLLELCDTWALDCAAERRLEPLEP
jgi:hypothetical protein